MIKTIVKVLIISVLYTLSLIVVGYAISFFFTNHPQSLGLILFIVGALPIIFFISELFTQSTSGSKYIPIVIFRVFSIVIHGKNSSQQLESSSSNKAFSLSMVLSGIIIWFVSYFV